MRHRTRARAGRILLSLIAAATVAVAVTACGGAEDEAPEAADVQAGTDAQADADANAADVMFVQMMIPHHEQAVVMADDALDISEDPDLRALAEQIRAAQQPEIEQMQGWLDEWGVPEMMDGDMAGHMGHGGMDGMMSEEDLDELRQLTGSEFDDAWTRMMIEHHEGALDMAQDVREDGRSPEVRELADEIITAQQAEIELMTSWTAEDGR